MSNVLRLIGRLFINAELECKSGLHIGSGKEKMEIGGIDNSVVKDPYDNYPYIPGSSLKGAMRSKLEVYLGKELKSTDKTEDGEERTKDNKPPIRIHECNDDSCEVCRVFGRSADKAKDSSRPTLLHINDSLPTEDTIEQWDAIGDSVEIKSENQLDRITAFSNPRKVERVPAGSKFSVEMYYNIYNDNDIDYLKYVFEAMKHLEEEYLGGYGSRGYGRIKFKDIKIELRNRMYYDTYDASNIKKLTSYENVEDVLKDIEGIKGCIKDSLSKNGA